MLQKSHILRVVAMCMVICLSLLRADSVAAKPTERINWHDLSANLCSDDTVPEPMSADLWFPPASVATPSIHAAALTAMDTSTQLIRANEQTLIPLPAGEWTGLTCLMGLALVRARKAIRKMIV